MYYYVKYIQVTSRLLIWKKFFNHCIFIYTEFFIYSDIIVCFFLHFFNIYYHLYLLFNLYCNKRKMDENWSKTR